MDGQAPPRCLVLLGDWSNIVAGVSLVISFSILCAALTFKAVTLTGTTHAVFQWTMAIEGVFWAIGGASLAAVNVYANNASLAVVQTIICFGGIFFAISGWGDGVPGNIIGLRYVVPISDFAHVHVQDAAPFWGITCFMIATSMSLRGVWVLPKNRIVSPFWGVGCFFIGAWIIGVICLWGPTLVDGFIGYGDLKENQQYTLPPFAWSWIHVFQVIGAAFLEAGALIFGIMDGLFGGKSGGDTNEFSDEESSTDAEN